MLKRVTPADPKASIPDPERGDYLPPEGRVVPWTPFWAGMAARGEIGVADPASEAAAAPAPEPEPAHEPAPEPAPAV